VPDIGRRTKIIATIGPASDSPGMLDQLLSAGVDVARVGLAHGPIEASLDRIAAIKAAVARSGRHVGILADLPGPKVRVAPFAEGGIQLPVGQVVRLVDAGPESRSDASVIAIDYEGAVALLEAGDKVAMGDGGVELIVEARAEGSVLATVASGGLLRGRPGVNLPPERVPLMSPTPDDLVRLERVLEVGVDSVAVSFVQHPEDVLAIRHAIGSAGPTVIAKIETRAAVDNLEQIIRVSDGVMVARGDLGVRVPMEDVPHIQKRIIRLGVGYGKPVITATQMLESMIQAPSPTRAEVTDVANAVFDGTSALMLSGETAVGDHPVAAVAAMARIALRAEREFDYEGWGARLGRQQMASLHDANATVKITSAITAACWRASVDLDLGAIICTTRSGATARAISRFRPTAPIIAMTPNPATARQLAMAWGIQPVVTAEQQSTDDIIWFAVKTAAELGIVHAGDIVAVLAGSPREPEPVTEDLRLVRVR
jgi:pyruvate kinase